MMRREKEKLERTLGDIGDMTKVPSAVWIVDTNKEHLGVAEGQQASISPLLPSSIPTVIRMMSITRSPAMTMPLAPLAC